MINKFLADQTIVWIAIFLIICVIIYILFTLSDLHKYSSEHMINVPMINSKKAKWYRTNSCIYNMNTVTNDVLKQTAKKTNNYLESDLIFPCGYNDINDEINSLPISNGAKRVFIIEGADEITAKNYLWTNILNYYGIDYAKKLSPATYLLTEPDIKNEIKRLTNDHYPGKLYIMKKNIQRQTGLKITNDINEIQRNYDRYVIVQHLLQNSYLVNGRKINLRVYIVVICYKSKTDVFMFNDGFMYYTKKEFEKGNIDSENHITTGYVERDVYTKNPLTHRDFKFYLDLPEGNKYYHTNQSRKLNQIEKSIRNQGKNISDVIFDRIEKLIAEVFITFKGRICKKTDNNNNPVPIYDDYSVQLFGADVAINDKMEAQIIEINKGPDLSPKDERDGKIKLKLMSDTMEIIGIVPVSKDNGLIRVLEM